LKGGKIGESGTEEIIKFLEDTVLYDQFPTEFVLFTLTIKLSFLDVRAKLSLRADI
jgi:hypothetical protein